MKFLATVLLAFAAAPVAHACLGLESERAQERDAIVKFVGTATEYRAQKNGHALVTFKVSRTLRGESRQTWSLYFRSQSLPSGIAEFQKRFGPATEVGLREMIAPGEKSDSSKKAFYIVDAACSMNGEDWLLRRVEPSKAN